MYDVRRKMIAFNPWHICLSAAWLLQAEWKGLTTRCEALRHSSIGPSKCCFLSDPLLPDWWRAGEKGDVGGPWMKPTFQAHLERERVDQRRVESSYLLSSVYRINVAGTACSCRPDNTFTTTAITFSSFSLSHYLTRSLSLIYMYTRTHTHCYIRNHIENGVSFL